MNFPRFAVLAFVALTGLAPHFVAAQGKPASASLQLVAEGLTSPLAFVPLKDGRALIADQIGLVRLLERDGKLAATPVLSVTNRLSAINHGSFDERGLLCLALHPDFEANRRVFAVYTAPRRATAPTNYDCTLRLSEFTLPAGEPLHLDPQSEQIVLEVDKPYFNHNGGRIAFGPDGFLYMSVGDGGGPVGCDIGNGHALPNTNATSVQYTVTFDQSVTGVDAADFKVTTAGSVTATSPVVVSGSGASYSVMVNGIHGSGDLRLALIDDDSIAGAGVAARGRGREQRQLPGADL